MQTCGIGKSWSPRLTPRFMNPSIRAGTARLTPNLSFTRHNFGMARIPVEIVCCSVDDCLEAVAGGADRIELCGAITVGGLTPSIGTLIEAKRRIQIPIV